MPQKTPILSGLKITHKGAHLAIIRLQVFCQLSQQWTRNKRGKVIKNLPPPPSCGP